MNDRINIIIMSSTARPSLDTSLSFDLGIQGYVGVREGVSGSLRMKYEFDS